MPVLNLGTTALASLKLTQAGNPARCDAAPIWHSSNPGVATVTPQGDGSTILIQTVAAGLTNITCGIQAGGAQLPVAPLEIIVAPAQLPLADSATIMMLPG